MAVTVVASAVLVYIDGWKDGFRRIAYLGVALAVYLVAIRYFGDRGKNAVAIAYVIIAVVVYVYLKITGKSTWW